MTVLVVGIGRLVGNAYREKSNYGSNQVEPGVGGFGEDAQAAGGDAHNYLEQRDGDGRKDRVAGHGPLFRPHRVGAVDRGGT